MAVPADPRRPAVVSVSLPSSAQGLALLPAPPLIRTLANPSWESSSFARPRPTHDLGRSLTGIVRGMARGDQQFDALREPDPHHPDWVFISGGDHYCVRILPVAVPTWGSRTLVSGDDLGGSVALGAAVGLRLAYWRWVVRDRDNRLKVVVSRRRHRRPWSRTVGLDFCTTDEGAAARQREILETWDAADLSQREPIGPSVRKRLRRDAQP